MTPRQVAYRCPVHGALTIDTVCGPSIGRAPLETICPRLGCGRKAKRKNTQPNRRAVSVTAAAHQRLKAHCDALGIAMSELVDKLTADIGGGS